MRAKTSNAGALEPAPGPAGIHFTGDAGTNRKKLFAWLDALALLRYVRYREERDGLAIAILDSLARAWMPLFDTTGLIHHLDLRTENPADIEREIVLAMLAAPKPFAYPSFEEFAAAVRIRRNIVVAARKTQLSFDTSAAERPEDCWTYSEDRGFTVLPGKPLIAALQKATQPDASGKLYSFSCYRASEYVTLLGIAQELKSTNPPLLERLQTQWETRAIMSGRFHEIFLDELGCMDAPLPAAYYVPGDRLWFRNPDARSSDIEGYEGSWVFYLGGGLFSNFWERKRPFTITTKLLEIFHWRHGARPDDKGQLKMDETLVDARVQASLRNPMELQQILDRMLRLRDPQGVYGAGGCLDASREYPRRVCPGTTDIVLPCL
ncbi:MAG: hypothetical protein AAB150_19100 [Pseudomonadota bacterium]